MSDENVEEPIGDEKSSPIGPEPAADAAAGALARYRGARRVRDSTPVRPRRSRRRRMVGELRSGPRPDGRDPVRLGSALSGLVRGRGWTSDLAVWALTNRWHEIVGPQIATHVQVAEFRPEGPAEAANEAAADARTSAPARSEATPAQQQTLDLGGPASPRDREGPGAPEAARSSRRAGAEASPDDGGGGLLVLQADSKTWQDTMVWNLNDLQRRLDKELGRGVVTTIVVRGPQARRSYGSRRVPPSRRR